MRLCNNIMEGFKNYETSMLYICVIPFVWHLRDRCGRTNRPAAETARCKNTGEDYEKTSVERSRVSEGIVWSCPVEGYP